MKLKGIALPDWPLIYHPTHCQDIDKTSTEINRRKVQIETGDKTIKKLRKAIEESKNEKERLTEEHQKLKSSFKEIEQKAFTVQEKYKKTQEVSTQIDTIRIIYMNDLLKSQAVVSVVT